jgi:hypothetical protein
VQEYRLLRAFDFTVEPKKRYRYRVKAKLENPNFNVAAKYLKNPAVKQAEHVFTAASNITPVVAIPDRYGVLAVPPADKIRASDPQTSVMVTAIDPATGTEVAAQFDAGRGSIANLSGVKAEEFDPRDSQISAVESQDIASNIVILDIRGGQVASKKSTSDVLGPVELLVVDDKGNLTVRNDLRDRGKVDSRLPPEEAPRAKGGDSKAKGDPVENVDRGGNSRSRAKRDTAKEKAPSGRPPARP